MLLRIFVIILCGLLMSVAQATDNTPELQQQVQQLTELVQSLQKQLHQVQLEQQKLSAERGDRTRAQVVQASDDIADRRQVQTNNKPNAQNYQTSADNSSFVDLSGEENNSIEDINSSHVLANPWWRNFNISGFAASGFYDTGSAGNKANGGFAIKEASLFIEGEVWEDIAFFLELQTNRLGKDSEVFTRAREVYAHFRNIQLFEDMPIGIKIGRIDIPFGEEYLWQDAIDNPLITNSAGYVYGVDEGILVYGAYEDLNWIVAVTDGTDALSADDNSDKALNLKLYGNPFESLYLSLSLMRNGESRRSALEVAVIYRLSTLLTVAYLHLA